jgi:hypothetical protein
MLVAFLAASGATFLAHSGRSHEPHRKKPCTG